MGGLLHPGTAAHAAAPAGAEADAADADADADAAWEGLTHAQRLLLRSALCSLCAVLAVANVRASRPRVLLSECPALRAANVEAETHAARRHRAGLWQRRGRPREEVGDGVTVPLTVPLPPITMNAPGVILGLGPFQGGGGGRQHWGEEAARVEQPRVVWHLPFTQDASPMG